MAKQIYAFVALCILVGSACVIPPISTHAAAPAPNLAQSGTVTNLDTGLTYASINAAIGASETLPGHRLHLSPGRYTENVLLNKSISLTGDDPVTTVLDGAKIGRTVDVSSSVTATMSNVTIENGLFDGTPSMFYGGAGIRNLGTLSIHTVTVQFNESAYFFRHGNAIANFGAMTVTNGLIRQNTGMGTNVSAIWSRGQLTLEDTVIADNAQSGALAAIDGHTKLSKSTVSNNSGGVTLINRNCSGPLRCNGPAIE